MLVAVQQQPDKKENFGIEESISTPDHSVDCVIVFSVLSAPDFLFNTSDLVG